MCWLVRSHVSQNAALLSTMHTLGQDIRNQSGCRIAVVLRKRLDLEMLVSQLYKATRLEVAYLGTDLEHLKSHEISSLINLFTLDASLPRREAFNFAEMLQNKCTIQRVLLLDHCYVHWHAEFAKSVNAAYLTREDNLAKVINSIKLLVNEWPIKPSRENGLIANANRNSEHDPRINTLTRREFEVMQLIASGLSVRTCAEQLRLSTSTVDNHKSRLMKKLRVHKATDLVRVAIRTGIVEA